MFIKVLAVVAAISLTGCQAMVYGTASDFEKISLGMTKGEVIEVLGSPVSVSADADRGEEYLEYKRMRHAISDWPRMYTVTLRNGHVVKYGEQQGQNSGTIVQPVYVPRPAQVQAPQLRVPSTDTTNCQFNGNQMDCTTRKNYGLDPNIPLSGGR